MIRLLLVEDDDVLGLTLKDNLELENYQVTWIQNGSDALQTLKSQNFDLIVLDVMLPEIDGLEILKNLRAKDQTPVLMISAKGTAHDRIRGLSLEADDYLAKPFHLSEFLLRIKNILRRSQNQAQPSLQSPLQIGLAEFDLQAWTVKLANGHTENLTAKELGVLTLLIRQPNKVISREDILKSIWTESDNASTRTIDNIIVKLRKWIEHNPADPQWIISHRGVGYSYKGDI